MSIIDRCKAATARVVMGEELWASSGAAVSSAGIDELASADLPVGLGAVPDFSWSWSPEGPAGDSVESGAVGGRGDAVWEEQLRADVEAAPWRDRDRDGSGER